MHVTDVLKSRGGQANLRHHGSEPAPALCAPHGGNIRKKKEGDWGGASGSWLEPELLSLTNLKTLSLSFLIREKRSLSPPCSCVRPAEWPARA